MQPDINESSQMSDILTNTSAAAEEGAGRGADSEAVVQQGGQAVEALGDDLGRAASGEMRDVDMDSARQRMRDCQSSLLALGYSLGEHEDSADGITGTADAPTVEAVKLFQDDNDLDVTGIIDRDTYETLLRSFEGAMSMRAGVQGDDDFMPVHPNEAMQQTADTAGDEGLQDELDVLDDSEQTALDLRDELREVDDDDAI